MTPSELNALSPVDGRYRAASRRRCARCCSEAGLIRERIRVEAQLAAAPRAAQPSCRRPLDSRRVRERAPGSRRPPPDDAGARQGDRSAHQSRREGGRVLRARAPARRRCQRGARSSCVHFGCTSEDINNLSYARLLRERARIVLLPALTALHRPRCARSRASMRDPPMLARTHGQPATPTTLGKEFANFAARLRAAARALRRGARSSASGTARSATSTRTSPRFRTSTGRRVAARFVDIARARAQRLHHADRAARLDRANTATRSPRSTRSSSTCAATSGATSRSAICASVRLRARSAPRRCRTRSIRSTSRTRKATSASPTRCCEHFAEKLPVSRWQRDLTDSTVLRNLGVALGHTPWHWRRSSAGSRTIDADRERLAADLDGAWEVLGRAGADRAARARRAGRLRAAEGFHARPARRTVNGCTLSSPLWTFRRRCVSRLLQLTPATYLGAAESLARQIP